MLKKVSRMLRTVAERLDGKRFREDEFYLPRGDEEATYEITKTFTIEFHKTLASVAGKKIEFVLPTSYVCRNPPKSIHFTGLACIDVPKEREQEIQYEVTPEYVLLPDTEGTMRKVPVCDLDCIEELYVKLDPIDQERIEKYAGRIEYIAIWALVPGFVYIKRDAFNPWLYVDDEVLESFESQKKSEYEIHPALDDSFHNLVGIPYRVIG